MVHCPRHHAHTISVQVFTGGLCSIHDIFEQLANENTELHCVPGPDKIRRKSNDKTERQLSCLMSVMSI